MKKLTCTAPGFFEYGTAEIPKVQSGYSLIKIKKIGICGTDIHAFEGTQPFFSYPRVLGHELGAEFVSGDKAEGFTEGEAITIIPYFHCGKCIACRSGKTNCCQHIQVAGVHTDGGMAEYFAVPSYSLVHGQGLSPSALALVEPLAVSVHGVKRAGIQPGEFVLIVGAGPIGLGAMEFARLAGAKVIALDVNEYRLQFCRQVLQTDFTINAAQEDVKTRLGDITGGDMPTVVIDATGSQKAINNAFAYMAHTARYVLIGLQKSEISFSHPEFHKREATLMSSRNATRADFDYVIDCLKQGLVRPETYITHHLQFDDVKSGFQNLLAGGGVIKAMVSLGE